MRPMIINGSASMNCQLGTFWNIIIDAKAPANGAVANIAPVLADPLSRRESMKKRRLNP